MSVIRAATDLAYAAIVASQQDGQREFERQREEWQMERERWERERERERVAAQARDRLGGLGALLLLLEEHKTLIFSLISLYTFHKVVMKLIDLSGGFFGFFFSLLILVSLR
ncbi:hypothetical protein FRC00_014114, partial [Tulasnella sp. 408]